MAIFSVTIPIDSAPGGSARFLTVVAILLAIGVLAVPCGIVVGLAVMQAIAEALV